MNENLVYTFLPPQGYDLAAARRRVTDALAAFAAHNETNRLAEDVCNALKSHIRIDWIGPVCQLMTGDDEFARSVRAGFLDLEEPSSADAIGTAQEAEFLDFPVKLGVRGLSGRLLDRPASSFHGGRGR